MSILIQLGRNQRSVLKSLVEHGGSWSWESRWYRQSRSLTKAVLESLIDRGMVDKTPRVSIAKFDVYTITREGRRTVRTFDDKTH